jgi:hypothetical protein
MLTTDQKVQVVMEGQERLIRKLETVEQEVKRSRKVRVYTNFGLALLLMIVWPFSLNNVTDGVEREAYFATYDAVPKRDLAFRPSPIQVVRLQAVSGL